METVEQKVKLGKMVTDLYEQAGVETIPLFPKILLRVLPKEQKVGSIYLPEGSKQNKPTWEGVVIRVYEPFFQKVYLSEVSWVRDDPDPVLRYVQKCESELKPGDHVLFPHIEYGITPISLDGGRGDYRCVPEHLIMARVNYRKETTREWLREFIGSSELAVPELVDTLLQNADVIRRDVVSLTISGK